MRHLAWLLGAAMIGGAPAITAQPARPAPTPAPATGTPAPELIFAGSEPYRAGERRFVRYWFDVLNKWRYPAELFSNAPQLPPCGNNSNASRTWVDFYAEGGQRLYGFCALNEPVRLGMIWFALPEGQAPPARVYVEMRDRQTNMLYRSNLARTAR